MKSAIAILLISTISLLTAAPTRIDRETTSADSFQHSLESVKASLDDAKQKSILWDHYSPEVQSGKAYYQNDGKLSLIRLFESHSEGNFRKVTETQFYVSDNQLKSVLVYFTYLAPGSDDTPSMGGINYSEMLDLGSRSVTYWLWGSDRWVKASESDPSFQKVIEFYQKRYLECLHQAEQGAAANP